MKPDEIVNEIKASGLVGRGGAAFPTGIKWEGAAKAEANQKYVICNADESEPGTFKDRVLLIDDPHRNIEGMCIAGYAIGDEAQRCCACSAQTHGEQNVDLIKPGQIGTRDSLDERRLASNGHRYGSGVADPCRKDRKPALTV